MSNFEIVSDFKPTGDQPQAIEGLTEGLKKGERFQTLLGVTGSGKTFTMAGVIENVQRPTLIISHNKTLAAQLCQEFRNFFPKNAVEYFVSYYDYYQPEAYIPHTDTYIAKDASINDQIDRLRHSATRSLLERRDVIIVASVSCIYGLGTPEDYLKAAVFFDAGKDFPRDEILKSLVAIHYERNDYDLSRGKFRVRGNVIEIYPAYEEHIVRVETFGQKIEKIKEVDPVTGEVLAIREKLGVYPATHYVTFDSRIDGILRSIGVELQERLKWFREHDKLLEAQRLEQRTKYDMEMIKETGYCHGIENYSRHFDGRAPGQPSANLIEYFPKDLLTFMDESHVTFPQLHSMYEGDRARKKALVEHGFRLPSAYDNRPLKFKEFEERIGQVVFVSATPADYEKKNSSRIVEQIIRPTGLIDPALEVRPIKGQIDDLVGEIEKRVGSGERVLVTTLTKRMAEDLAEYLFDEGIKVRYLHSDIKTLERIDILRDLRLGKFDVLVGINLLREGLDLPEVSLVAILDADKEGFLRAETSLIQTIGRAARNVNGKVILYADRLTGSMKRAINETDRRRKLQVQYNKEHGIIPKTIVKEINDIKDQLRKVGASEVEKLKDFVPKEEVPQLIAGLEQEMKMAAIELEFERAAQIRDQIAALKKAFKGKVVGL